MSEKRTVNWRKRAWLAEKALAKMRAVWVKDIASGEQMDIIKLMRQRDKIIGIHDEWVEESRHLREDE